ncbi:hypothetical protein, partial [Methylacidimicrobium cyclopophantes]|uniref:hypothetical protein n=1 Tax=Methylacidimicrobium cyclopophantes TaxID=1041766 RepID=UPI001C49BB95
PAESGEARYPMTRLPLFFVGESLPIYPAFPSDLILLASQLRILCLKLLERTMPAAMILGKAFVGKSGRIRHRCRPAQLSRTRTIP